MAHLYLVDSAVTTVFKFSCSVLPRGEGVDSTVPAVAVHVVASVRSHAVWNMLLGTLYIVGHTDNCSEKRGHFVFSGTSRICWHTGENGEAGFETWGMLC